MKNFTKQITNKTLFKPTRWILLALMLLLGTSGAWATYLYTNDSRASGIQVSYTNTSGTETSKWYRINDTANMWENGCKPKMYSDNSDFESKSLGTLTDFKLTGGEVNVRLNECNSGCNDYAEGRFYYKVYKQTESEPANYTKAFDANTWECGARWDAASDVSVLVENQSTDMLSGKSAGNYYIKIKMEIQARWSGGTFGDTWTNEAKAKFTIPGYYPTSSTLDFGDVDVNKTSAVKTVSTTHFGSTTTPTYTISGDAKDDFNVTSVTTSQVKVTFTPSLAGVRTATIIITDTHGKTYELSVSGNGKQSCQDANVAIDNWNIPDVMCKDDPATFTYSAEANAAVTWSTDNANFNIVDNNKTVTVTYTGGVVSSNNVLKYTVTDANGFCPESGVDSDKRLSAQGGVEIAATTETDQTVCPNGTTTIGVTEGMTSYTWKYGEQVMSGKTTSSIEVGAGQYSVTATNANGCVSNSISFDITAPARPITAMNIGFVSGNTTVMSITACGEVGLKFWATGATRYEIYENIGADNDIANDVKIAEGDMKGDGPENAIVYSISKDDPGTYKFYAKVLNECTSATLEQRTLTVPATIDAPGYTLTQPSQCNNTPTDGLLKVTKVDGISYTISPALDGSVDAGWTLTAVNHTAEKTYTITATKTTGACTRTATTEVTVQTEDKTPVVNDIAIKTASTTVCAGSELTLQLKDDAQDGVTFQWYKGRDAIANATSSSLTIQNVTDSDAGEYKLVASKTTPCTVTKESDIITISVDAQSKLEVSAAESFCLGTPVNLTEKVTATTGTVTWYTNQAGTEPVDNTTVTVSANATYYAKAQNGVCPATGAVAYSITAKGATISKDIETVNPYEVTTFTASKPATWELTANPASGEALSADDPTFSGKTTAYITKAAGITTTFKGEAAEGYVIKATADDCETTLEFDVVADPNNCE